MKGSSSMLAGVPTKDFEIFVAIDNKNNIFQQRIKHCYDLSKKDNTSQDSFFVHLEKQKSANIISLKLTEEQVEQILQKPSAMRPILVGLGVVGLIAALVCYLNHSKCMALLGRG